MFRSAVSGCFVDLSSKTRAAQRTSPPVIPRMFGEAAGEPFGASSCSVQLKAGPAQDRLTAQSPGLISDPSWTTLVACWVVTWWTPISIMFNVNLAKANLTPHWGTISSLMSHWRGKKEDEATSPHQEEGPNHEFSITNDSLIDSR